MNKSLNDIIQQVRENRKPLKITKVDNSMNKPDVEMKAADQGDRPKRRRIRNPMRRQNRTLLDQNRGNIRNNRRGVNRNVNLRNRRNNGDQPKSTQRTRLFVSNLHQSTTNSDLKVIFDQIGPLRRCGIHWNELGQSKGTADVEYVFYADAFRAKNRYNNKTIKGQPIRIEIIKGTRSTRAVDRRILNRPRRGLTLRRNQRSNF